MGRFALRRGDIIIANFEPVKGSEQGGIRPALIIQNNTSNEHSPTIIVAPITSKKDYQKTYVTNVPISKKESKLPKDSLILCNQIRTIDKSRVTRRISGLNPYLMFQVDTAIKISLGLDN